MEDYPKQKQTKTLGGPQKVFLCAIVGFILGVCFIVLPLACEGIAKHDFNKGCGFAASGCL